jgi:phosphoglycerate dehydrogenase-like enzyme
MNWLITDRTRGAGLDVIVEEPPAPEHKLFTLPNIVLMLHMGGRAGRIWKKAFCNASTTSSAHANEKPLRVILKLQG